MRRRLNSEDDSQHSLSHSLSSCLLTGQSGLPERTNFVRIQYLTSCIVRGAEDETSVYDVDVPPDVFQRMLKRAACHAGYSPRDVRLRTLHVRDLVLEEDDRSDARFDTRLVQERLLGTQELPGAPVLISWLHRARLPMSSFPCGQRPHDVRYVQGVSLRVHRRAHLVFEAHRGVDHPPDAIVHAVHLDIDLSGDTRALAKDMADLSRTVENTVQIVLMGARPRGRYGSRH